MCLLLLALLFGAGISLSAYYINRVSKDLPQKFTDPIQRPEEGITITDRNGVTLATFGKKNKTFTPLSKIPKHIIATFVAVEDKRFWHHTGADPFAMARAAWLALTGKRITGASTITQQVVKNILLNDARTLERKVQEIILARRLERDLGKHAILETYLNEIYLGAGAYGIAAAAEVYFGEPLNQLNTAQVALLAGLPKAPSAYNPRAYPEKALKRRNFVISRLHRTGLISQSQLFELQALPLDLKKAAGKHTDTGIAYSTRLMLKHQPTHHNNKASTLVSSIDEAMQANVFTSLQQGLIQLDLKEGWAGPEARNQPLVTDWISPPNWAKSQPDILTPAIVQNITDVVSFTTPTGIIHLDLDDVKETVVRSSYDLRVGDGVFLSEVEGSYVMSQRPRLDGAAMVMDVNNGQILAMSGGFSFSQSQFNRALQARRQTGSLMKPLVALSALQNGYTPQSLVLDIPIKLRGTQPGEYWAPHSPRPPEGPISLKKAIVESRNYSAVRLLHKLGIPQLKQTASRLDIKLARAMDYSIALGTNEMTPAQVGAMFSAFANGGVPVVPTLFAESEKNTYNRQSPISGNQYDRSFHLLNDILKEVPITGTAKHAFRGYTLPIAVKTGTTNQSRDVWTVAYNKNIVVVVWIGRDDYSPLPIGTTGGNSAAYIVRNILEALPDRYLHQSNAIKPLGAEQKITHPAIPPTF